MSNLIDSYSESNYDTDANMYAAGSNGNGQSFTGNGDTLGSAVFYLKKVGSPTGNAVAKVYAHSGTYGTSSVPTGTALATSANYDVSTLTTSFQLITFAFSGGNQIALTNGTKYVVTVEYSDASSSFPTNYIKAGGDSSSPAHGGNRSNLSSGSWSALNAYDICFYVYDNITGASPVAGTPVQTQFASSVTSMAVNMPATVNAGDRLIAVVSVRNSGTWSTIPTGWSQLKQQLGGGSASQLTVFEKIAAGTEAGTTPTWVASATTTAVWQSIRVTGAHASTASEVTSTSGDATAADPPSNTPTGGPKDYLSIAVAGHAAVSAAAFTAGPAGYTGFQNNGASSGGSAVSVATANKQLAAATTEDPGAFTAGGSNRFWAAATVMVYPAAGGAVNGTVTQVAATVTAAGGTQVVSVAISTAVTQVAATITATGGTQASFTVPGGNTVNESMASSPATGSIKGATAYWNAGGWFQLTDAITFQSGAFEYDASLGSIFEVQFDFYTSAGGADASWFYWGASATPTGEGDGDGGYHVVFDDYSGAIYPYRLMWNGTGNEIADAGTPGSPTFANAAWHTANIAVNGNRIVVYVDSVLIFDFTDTTRTLGGTKYGWAGRTGGAAAEHRVRNLKVDTTVGTSASITQVAATVTAAGGTQVVASVQKVAITQAAATVTVSGGTQTNATINNVAISQVAGTVTASGGTQVIATSNFVAIAQVAGTVTASGGTQSLGSVINGAITQVAGTVTASGGTQVVSSTQLVAITQVAGTVTASGGTQVVSAGSGTVSSLKNFVILTNGTLALITATNQRQIVTLLDGRKALHVGKKLYMPL